jgi:prepilin-type N-terminal cleavage/methylation domain-containing protein
MSARRSPGSGARAGFSLLELMVALTVGGIAITSIYAVGSASTRVFYQQQQVANAQTSLRMAMDQLKRDIARAGYLGTPGLGLQSQACGPVPTALHTAANPLAAITRYANDLVPVGGINDNIIPVGLAAPTVNRTAGFTIDDVVLIGNYETASEYAGVSQVDSDTVRLSDSWHAFQRDFTTWYQTPHTNDPPAIDRAFPPNRLIRLRLTNGLFHFGQVSSISGNTAGAATTDLQIDLNAPIDPNCLPSVDGAFLAPVNAMRYVVRNAAGALDQARASGLLTGPMAQLFREEVLPTDKVTPFTYPAGMPPNRRAILDFVVGFNLAFTLTTDTGIGNADQYTINQTEQVPANVNNSLQRIRSVIVDLAVRTPEQDPTFPWTANNCALQQCYRVFDDRPGAARVRRMRAEVFVPNIAAEGY